MKILHLLFFLLATSASQAQPSPPPQGPRAIHPGPNAARRSVPLASPARAKKKMPPVNVTFTEEGRVATGPDVFTGKDKAFKPDTLKLTKWSATEMAKAKKNLVSLFSKTAVRLRSTTLPQQAYYRWLWGTDAPEALANQLEGLTSALPASTAGYTKGPPSLSTLATLDSVLQTSFSKDSVLYHLDSLVDNASKEQVLTLRKKFILNDFILTYFSKVARQPANAPYDTLSRRGMEHLVAAARHQQTWASHLLARVAKEHASLTLPLLDSLASSHQRVQALGLLQLLRAPWSQQWLWYTGGVLRLNPLPFTDDALLRAHPTNDTTKAGYLRRYTTRMLGQYQRARKDTKVASYLEDVRFVGQEKTLFVDSAAYKHAVVRNRATAQEFQTTGRIVNKVRTPLRQPALEYLSFTSSTRDELAKVRRLAALTTDTRVVASVHNLEYKHTLQLKHTQATLIKDQSGTQKALDEGLTSLGALAPDLLGIAAKAAQLNIKYAFKPKLPEKNQGAFTISNSAKKLHLGKNAGYHKILPPLISLDSGFWRETKALVARRLHDTLDSSLHNSLLLSSYGQVQPVLWERVRQRAEFVSLVAKGIAYGLPEPDYERLIQDIGAYYLRLHLADYITPALVELLRTDTLYLGTSIGLADTASLPPHRVKPRLDTDPLWHTERAVTGLSDSTKSYVYVLQDVPPKGSTTEPVSFASFSYSTGKRHIVQFSAGLAYSFQPVRTPELTTTGSQLTYATTDTRFRVFAGVHVYPFQGGVFLQDKHFLGLRPGNWRAFSSRINVQLALGIPHPLDNVYLGLGYDLGPGIRVCAGVHLHGYTAYEVANNRVLTQGNTYEALPYLSVGIDPVTFVKSLAIFK